MGRRSKLAAEGIKIADNGNTADNTQYPAMLQGEKTWVETQQRLL